jgi:adenosylhomocysteinase
MSGERLLIVCHLDVKTVPYFEALVEKGAEVWAHAANTATTRDAVADHLGSMGVHARARKGDPPERHAAHLERAVAAGPTLLSEMGADATASTKGHLPSVRGGIEATGTGIKRLAGLDLRYPVFDWDGVPIKRGLHNRHLVGLMAANTFLNVTGLSLYGKAALVVGYGPVGRGAADAARAFGAAVTVCDPDPAARLAAAPPRLPRDAASRREASWGPTSSSPPRAATAPSPSTRSLPTARAAHSWRTSATRAANCR